MKVWTTKKTPCIIFFLISLNSKINKKWVVQKKNFKKLGKQITLKLRLKRTFKKVIFLFVFLSPYMRGLQFKNVKLNLKFIILNQKLAQKPNFSQLIVFFLGRPIILIFKTQLVLFEQSFSKIQNFDLRFEFLGQIVSQVTKFINLGLKLRS